MDNLARTTVFHFESEFDDFLYAPICEEKNGMPLSVLSALARQNIDPWKEAARLAGLPQKTATQRLATLIVARPVELPPADVEMISARLVTLLPPRRGGLASHPNTSSSGGDALGEICAFLYLILMLLALNPQWITANPQPAAQIETASSAADPQGLFAEAAAKIKSLMDKMAGKKESAAPASHARP